QVGANAVVTTMLLSSCPPELMVRVGVAIGVVQLVVRLSDEDTRRAALPGGTAVSTRSALDFAGVRAEERFVEVAVVTLRVRQTRGALVVKIRVRSWEQVSRITFFEVEGVARVGIEQITNAVTASIPAATRGTAVGVDLVTVVTLFV